jgi:hypothetical protein
LTASVGLATLRDSPTDAAHLVELAETSLHKARETMGRSGIGSAGVVAYPDSADESPTLLYAPSKKP